MQASRLKRTFLLPVLPVRDDACSCTHLFILPRIAFCELTSRLDVAAISTNQSSHARVRHEHIWRCKYNAAQISCIMPCSSPSHDNFSPPVVCNHPQYVHSSRAFILPLAFPQDPRIKRDTWEKLNQRRAWSSRIGLARPPCRG